MANLLVYIRHIFNDYRDDSNRCKFSGLLSYTMYQLNLLISISLYKIPAIYINIIRMNEWVFFFSNGSFLGIAEVWNIYNRTWYTQWNIVKVIITRQWVLLKISNDYCCKLC